MAATGPEIASAIVALRIKMPNVYKDVEKQLGGVDADKAGRKVGSRFGSALKKAATVGALAATAAVATLGVAGFRAAVGIETSRKVLGGLYDDAGLATKTLRQLRDVSKDSPINYEAYTKAAESLAYAGIEGDAAVGTLKNVGLAISAAGGDSVQMEQAMRGVTKAVNNGGIAMMDSLGMISESGVPVLSGLAEHFDTTIDKVRKMASAGEVNITDVMAVLQNATGATFDQMLNAGEAAQQSFGNIWKSAKDSVIVSVGELMVPLLEKFAPVMKDVGIAVTEFVDGMRTGEGPGGQFAQTVQEAWSVTSGFVSTVVSGVRSVTAWVSANKDWLSALGVAAGIITGVTVAVRTFRAIQLGLVAATYGVQGAMIVTGGATKVYGAIMAAQAAQTKIVTVAQKAFNMAMRANPIGIVVTAIAALVAGLVYFFTQTETGQKIWKAFTQFLSEAWANISQFFQDTWNNVLKPVFEGIGAVFTWLWENILEPQMNALRFLFAIVGGIIVGVYETFIKPVLDEMGAVFSWLWENAIQPALAAIGKFFSWLWTDVIQPVAVWIGNRIQIMGLVFHYLWVKFIQPAFQKIGEVFKWVWANVISPVVSWIQEKIRIMGVGFQVVWSVIRGVWDHITGKIRNAWNTIKGVIDTLVRVVRSDPKKAFEMARDAIGDAWEKIKGLAKKPVVFVVDTVIGGMIDAINNFLPKKWELSKPSLPKGFSEGGYTGNLAANAVAGVVHGNEHVIRAQSRKALESKHPGLLDYMNRTGSVPGYRKGGLVHPLPGGRLTAGWLGYPGHRALDFAAAAGTRVRAAGAGTVRSAGWNNQGLGYNVDLNHSNGLVTRYSHMLANLAVKTGQAIKQRQTIGYVGSTGNSTGPHLHYEVHKGFQNRVNPTPYLSGGGESGGGGAFDALSGLMGWVEKKLSSAGAGVWGEVGQGMAMAVADPVIKWLGSKIPGHGGSAPTLFDSGGWLDPGTHLVQNKTRRPEPILTGSQWDAVRQGRGDVYVQNPFTGEYLLAKVDERAENAVGEFADGMESAQRQMAWR